MKNGKKIFGFFVALVATLIWCASTMELVDSAVGQYVMIFLPTATLFCSLAWLITGDKSIY